MADPGAKTEQPTQRKLEKARREGQFPVSREFVAAVQFLVFVAVLTWSGWAWMQDLLNASAEIIRRAAGEPLGAPELVRMAADLCWRVLMPVLAAGFFLMAVSMLVHLITTRMGFSLKKLTPNLSRLNSIAKLKEMPGQNMVSALQATMLLAFFGVILYWYLQRNFETIVLLPLADMHTGLGIAAASLTDMLWKATGFFLVFGLVDLFRQHRRFHKQMRMTRQEVADELKETEGNPQIRARIRRIQRDLLRRRMMSQIRTATAVVVNPTHYAVALRYEPNTMAAPVVVAKGKNYLALRIRQKALDLQIPLVENPPLAQGLYKAVQVGQEIPPKFYRAVAEILAYIHKLAAARRRPL